MDLGYDSSGVLYHVGGRVDCVRVLKCHIIYTHIYMDIDFYIYLKYSRAIGGGVIDSSGGSSGDFKRWWEKRAQGVRPTTVDKIVRRRGASRRRAPRAGPSVVRPIRLEVSEPPRIFAI